MVICVTIGKGYALDPSFFLQKGDSGDASNRNQPEADNSNRNQPKRITV